MPPPAAVHASCWAARLEEGARMSIERDLYWLGRALNGDPRAAEAYRIGQAAAHGWEDLPIPHDSVFETVIDGQPVRVLMVEPPG